MAGRRSLTHAVIQVVKELREKTGAGMMDCKKALRENNGDVKASMDYLRKKGLAGADKKAGRIASEGLVASYIHAGSGSAARFVLNQAPHHMIY